MEKVNSVLEEVTDSDLEECKGRYLNVLKEELHIIRDTRVRLRNGKALFEEEVRCLNSQKEREIKFGRGASSTTSLFYLLSVHVKPTPRPRSRPTTRTSSLSVWGEITSVSHLKKKEYIYQRKSDDVERFDVEGGYLTLEGPTPTSNEDVVHFLFQSKELSIRLYDQQGRLLYPLVKDEDPIILDYSGDDFEQVKQKVPQNTRISLTVNYVSIPMAVFGPVRISIYKRDYANDTKFVNVCGKVVAKYNNTFGNYNSQEFLLFDKKEPHRVQLDRGDSDLLSSSRSRPWVALPAYSLLHLHIDLLDCQKGYKLTQDVQLATEASSYRSTTRLLFGEYYITVSGIWCTPPPYKRFLVIPQSPQLVGRDAQIARTPPPLNPAIEIFSVLVFDEGGAPIRIRGRLQYSHCPSMEFEESGVDIFKRDEFLLSGRGNTIPVSNDFSSQDFFYPVSIICDLEANDGSFKIKGYGTFFERFLDTEQCYFFRGVHGFAALHYAVFSSAKQATLKVSVYQQKRKRSRSKSAVSGSIWAVSGTIFARYKHSDCSSQFKKDWYKIVLFNGRELMDADGPLSSFSVTLSRSSFFVPWYSSPIIDLDLMIGTQKFSHDIEAEFGISTRRSFKSRECDVECLLEWSEVE